MNTLTRKGFPGSGALVLAGGLALAALLGAYVASSPKGALLLVIGGIVVAIGVSAPLAYLAAGAVLVTAVVPSLIKMNVAPILGGQARVGVLLMAIAIGRVLRARTELRPPAVLLASTGVFVAALLVDALVATLSNAPASQTDNLSRELLYPSLAVIGFIAASDGDAARTRLTIFRGIALSAIPVFGASIMYWAWATHAWTPPGAITHVFVVIQKASGYQGRSVFPFAEDSPNLGAVAFVIIAALAIPPLLASRAKWDRRLAFATLLLGVGAVLTTQSRTGLVAIGAAGAAYVVLVARERARLRVAALAVAVLVGIFVVAPTALPQGRGLSTHTGTFQVRLDIWSQAWTAFAKDPVVGHGYGYSAGNVFQEAATATGAAASRNNSVHSEYLGQLVDGGVVGFGLFCAFIAILIGLARRLLRQRGFLPEALGYSTVLAAVLAGMIDSAFTKSAACVSLLWLAIGIAAANVARTYASTEP
jgi:O-antigen ligase